MAGAEAVLWMPKCPCGVTRRGWVYLHGDASGPRNVAEARVRWTCEGCGRPNYAPESEWAPVRATFG